jgi:group I intron endonuclease
MYIYKITNKINNKCYIGQTVNTIESRWKRHQQDALSNRINTHFASAIRKYSPENFTLELIDTAENQGELNQKEHDWIIYYNSIENGYNETSAISKCGGNTYKSKTEEELKEIGEKIRKSKIGGLNINSTKVKCRNINTREEYHFDSQAEMQKFFNSTNHAFISRRCLGKVKKPYLNTWEIAYEDKEYGESISEEAKSKKSNSKIVSITVKNLETNETKTFPTYSSAERYFGLKIRSFSSKAYQRPDTFTYKEKYEITKNY